MNTIYTIGFAKKSAETFFELLIKNNINTLVDVRLNNVSQLAGFTKKNDLIYFLKKIANIRYQHCDLFAPTKSILDAYKHNEISWNEYEVRYLELIKLRKLENIYSEYNFDKTCLLCSEPEPDYCHRRLAAQYLKQNNIIDKIVHL